VIWAKLRETKLDDNDFSNYLILIVKTEVR